MRLPTDNDLFLTDADPFVLDANDATALTDDEVLKLLPSWVRVVNTRLRRALVAHARRFWQFTHNRIGFALNAARSPRNASGRNLDAHGGRKRRPRAPNEPDALYRERLLSHPEVITPDAITAAVRAIVRAERPTDPAVIEPATEGFFVGASSSPWVCFAQQRGQRPLWGVFPDNPIMQVGVWLPTLRQSLGPCFVVILEGDLNSEAEAMYALPAGTPLPGVDTSSRYVRNVAAGLAWGYTLPAQASLERRVQTDVESRRGGGVVWVLYIEPNLGGAL